MEYESSEFSISSRLLVLGPKILRFLNQVRKLNMCKNTHTTYLPRLLPLFYFPFSLALTKNSALILHRCTDRSRGILILLGVFQVCALKSVAR